MSLTGCLYWLEPPASLSPSFYLSPALLPAPDLFSLPHLSLPLISAPSLSFLFYLSGYLLSPDPPTCLTAALAYSIHLSPFLPSPSQIYILIQVASRTFPVTPQLSFTICSFHCFPAFVFKPWSESVPTLWMPIPPHPGGPLKLYPAAVIWSLPKVISTQDQQLQVLHLLLSPETETPREDRSQCL